MSNQDMVNLDQTITEHHIALMAVKIEEKGVHFYSSVAKQMENPEAREMFEKLAEEEREHRKIFLNLAEQLEGHGRVLGQEEAQYLRALVSSNVFPDIDGDGSAISKIKEPKEALAIGIQAEKDAILFYHEMYQQIKSDKARQVLNELLEAEKMHLIEMREQMEEF